MYSSSPRRSRPAPYRSDPFRRLKDLRIADDHRWELACNGAIDAWSSLVVTLSVLFLLLFLTAFIGDLPYSVLAAMIMLPVFNLLDPGAFKRLMRISHDDMAVAFVTFIVTLAFAPRLHRGAFAGVGLTMATFLYRRTHPRIVEVSQHDDGTLRDRSRFDLPPLASDLLAVRMDSALNFLTVATLERFLNERIQQGLGT